MGVVGVALGISDHLSSKIKLDHWQLAAFALLCAFSVTGGVYIRANGYLGPRYKDQIKQVKRWTNQANITAEYATYLVTGSAEPRRGEENNINSSIKDNNTNENPDGDKIAQPFSPGSWRAPAITNLADPCLQDISSFDCILKNMQQGKRT
ncbi:hypothetical protein GCM10007874_11390 [Labrys miyagiensis]|uniref:Uncharacterized protein n=2 Tax=Labrys miyagiensis TaxID=346912 RepID=A0ABQ6CCM7_9HYPH|nr:hypothetical protein GCM10007874_11390 [Labrys miyagiensis]